MEPRSCNPLYGYRWLAAGFDLFLRQPWAWLALVGLSFLATVLLSTLPILGLVAVFLLAPGLAAGFMRAAQAAALDQPLSFAHLTSGFREAGRPLVAVGGANFLILLFAMVLLSLGFGEALERLLALLKSPTPDQAAIEEALSELTLPSLLLAAVLLPLALANWFAPQLVLFRGLSAGQAMRLSLQASLRNFWPFLVYGLLVFLLDLVVSLILRGIATAATYLAGETVAEMLGLLLVFPVVCTFFALGLAAMYVSYGDVFEAKVNPASNAHTPPPTT